MIGLAFALPVSIFFNWLERKLRARSQFRVGPPLLQPIYDLIKLFGKQNLRNIRASPLLSFLPLLYLVPITLLISRLPFGPWPGNIDLISIFFLLALASISSFLSGVLSFSPYGYFGARRELLQLVSYEAPLVLAILSPAILYSDFFLDRGFGFSLILHPACLVFFLSSLAKLRRSPFDLPNAIQEIVEGPFTEFSGPALALIHLSEWLETFCLSSLFYILFIGIPNLWLHLFSIFCFFLLIVLIDILTPRWKIERLMRFFWIFTFPLAVIEVGICWWLS